MATLIDFATNAFEQSTTDSAVPKKPEHAVHIECSLNLFLLVSKLLCGSVQTAHTAWNPIINRVYENEVAKANNKFTYISRVIR